VKIINSFITSTVFGGGGGSERRLLEKSHLISHTRQLILCLYFLKVHSLFMV